MSGIDIIEQFKDGLYVMGGIFVLCAVWFCWSLWKAGRDIDDDREDE